MDGKSLNIADDKLEQLKALLPEAFTEGKVDWEKLRLTLGEDVNISNERYTLNWAGKGDAFRVLQTPTTSTLAPVRDESVNFDVTENVFIEGENLEVLKIMQKSYYGKIKMIYIDPPYNTGNDSFVYPDRFAESREEYLKRINDKDEEGLMLREGLFRKNSKDSGHYHSNWLSMMYPRLFLARNLIRDDGVILISIDDNEVHNLRLLMNEVFGEENFIAQLVWEKGRKNDARLFSVGHEYMLVYSKSRARLDELRTVWREPKPGAKEIWKQYLKLREDLGDDDKAIEKALRTWYQSLPESHPSKKLSRYKHVDQWGPWRDTDISWPGGGGPRYDVIHPVTGKPCSVPERGWRFANPESMQRRIDLGLVQFREDHTEPPISKSHLRPIPEELLNDEAEIDLDDVELNEEDIDVGMQVMPSYIYKQSQVAVKYLRKLMGGKAFENPKDHEVLARIFKYVVEDASAIILDFFAGSGSTAEAVIQVNQDEGVDLKYILVQFPEPVPEKSPAKKLGYETIAEIGKSRIKKVYEKIKDENPLFAEQGSDLGFKVYKLKQSNFRLWRGDGIENHEELEKQLDLLVDPVRAGAVEENMLFEILLKAGYSLTTQVEKREVGLARYYLVDGELAVALSQLDESVVKDILKIKPQQVICLDLLFTNNDPLKTNTQLQFKDAGITFHSI